MLSKIILKFCKENAQMVATYKFCNQYMQGVVG
jgi:hypothetical protein